jgi:hypothetical protein
MGPLIEWYFSSGVAFVRVWRLRFTAIDSFEHPYLAATMYGVAIMGYKVKFTWE